MSHLTSIYENYYETYYIFIQHDGSIVLFCIMSTFVMMFSGIRQMLAIGLGFIAYDFTRKRKLMPFVLICLLALTVHTSAFMLLFMYPLYHARITRKSLMFLVPILAALFAFNQQIFGALVTEKVRSLGAMLVNCEGEAFMHPLETRDVTASSIIRECSTHGKGVPTPGGGFGGCHESHCPCAG